MTFGDRRGRTGATLVKHLGNDAQDHILGFYTGAIAPDDPNLDWYLYGYMAVKEVHDLSDLQGQEYHDVLSQFPENAHRKRLFAVGEPKHDDLVIVEGKAPAEKLSYPIMVSDRFSREFAVRGGQNGIGRKSPLILDLTVPEFLEKVKRR